MSINIVNNTKATNTFNVDSITFRKGDYIDAQPVGRVTLSINGHDGRSTYSFNHSFDTADLYVQVLEDLGGGLQQAVYPSITVTSTTLSASFSSFTPGGNYKIILFG